MLMNESIFSTLNGNSFSPLANTIRKICLIDSIEVKEVTKLAEIIKWIDRFCKSYTGDVNKVNYCDLIDTKIFVATYQGKELGYTRVIDMTKSFSEFSGDKVSRIAESYVKPLYRNQGVVTALHRYAVKHEHVKIMRIETYRFFKKKAYFESEGFFYAYSISDEMCIICTRDFFEPLAAYNKVMAARLQST